MWGAPPLASARLKIGSCHVRVRPARRADRRHPLHFTAIAAIAATPCNGWTPDARTTAVASSTASGPRARMEPRPASIATAQTRAIRRGPSAPRRSSAASLPPSPAASSPACCAHDAGVHVLASGSVPWLRVAGRCRGTAAVHTRRWTKQSDRDEPHEKAPCAAYAHLSKIAHCNSTTFFHSSAVSLPLFCQGVRISQRFYPTFLPFDSRSTPGRVALRRG